MIPADALRDLVRQLHSGPAQEAAAAKVAIALWRRATARGDAAAAEAALALVDGHLETLFDQLAALETRGRELLEDAERGS